MTQAIDRLAHIPLKLTVEVGAVALPLADILALKPDSVVTLDRAADEPLDILVNGALVARGEVVTVDGRYGVRITELADATRLAIAA